MTIPISTGLARLTIAAPTVQIDLAVPDGTPLAALMPVLLESVGEQLDGVGASSVAGWTLCRADGTRLALGRSLAAQQVRDGEILHLRPRSEEWPEPRYDDVVLGIADGMEKLGGRWQNRHTRVAGLAATAAALLVGLAVLLLSGPSWLVPGGVGLGVAAVLCVAGVVVARAFGDARAGAVLCALALPYGLVGGVLLLGGRRELTDLGAAHLLVGCAVLLLVSLAGFFGAVELAWVFVAGVVAALLGGFGAALSLLSVSGAGSAAVVDLAVLALLPMSALLAIRAAKVPMPELPQNAQDLLAERPVPPRDTVFDAVTRADQVLSGLLLGASVTSAGCAVLLISRGGVAAPLFAAVVAALLLLRSRMLPKLRQRVPVLLSGGFAMTLIVLGGAAALDRAVRPLVLYAGLLPVALLCSTLALRFSRRRPSPQLGRFTDLVELLLALAVVPVAAAVLGLYAYVRGLAG